MSRPRLTPDEMLKIYRTHAGAELAQNLEKTMDLVDENPVFEWPALNLRIEGREAVREMYSRLLRRATHNHVLFQRALATYTNGLIAEYVLSVKQESGPPARIGLVVLLEFDGDKVKKERTYTHPDYTPLLRAALGEDFDSLPGVSPINYEMIIDECVPAKWL